MLWPVLKALLGHYRRYPFQILLVWLGLTLGGSLLVGVTLINDHARVSYEHGEKLFDNPLPYRIRSKHSPNKIPQGFYVQLRRDGFQQCVPFDNVRVKTVDGTDITLMGIDPAAMMRFKKGAQLSQFKSLVLMRPPYPIMVSSELAAHMNWKANDVIQLQDGRTGG